MAPNFSGYLPSSGEVVNPVASSWTRPFYGTSLIHYMPVGQDGVFEPVRGSGFTPRSITRWYATRRPTSWIGVRVGFLLGGVLPGGTWHDGSGDRVVWPKEYLIIILALKRAGCLVGRSISEIDPKFGFEILRYPSLRKWALSKQSYTCC